jgi:2-furoyl-CoA dehydrogenase FAD binding subunit
MAAPWIGHPSTRSRGTVVGSLCHADPAGELGVCLLTLAAEVTVSTDKAGRTVAVADFFEGPLATAVGEGEMVTALRVPVPAPGTGYAFAELTRRHGDFALVAAAAVVKRNAAGSIESARLGFGGVGDMPVAFDVDGATDDWEGAARDIAASLDPPDDLQASAAYRSDMAARLAARVLADAAANAKGA